MLLARDRLQKLIIDYRLVKDGLPELIKSVHVDLRLGFTISRYHEAVDLKTAPIVEQYTLAEGQGYTLAPNDFILGSTLEEVSIPRGYWGFIETKGNIARAGLSSHNTDGHIDPGYQGTITLEIKNQNTVPVTLYPAIPFVQLFIFEISGDAPLYEGRYQYSQGPTLFKPDLSV